MIYRVIYEEKNRFKNFASISVCSHGRENVLICLNSSFVFFFINVDFHYFSKKLVKKRLYTRTLLLTSVLQILDFHYLKTFRIPTILNRFLIFFDTMDF